MIPWMPLVTGGAGFIGSALVRQLIEDGPVRVLDDLSTGKRANLEGLERVEFLEGSVLDPDVIRQAVDRVDVVFHMACLGVRHSIHSPLQNHEVNASGTLLLLEEARRAGVEKFVYTSTSEIYGTAARVPMSEAHPARPHTVYGGSKLAGEAYTRAYHKAYGLPTVVIRPFNSYGPRSHHEGDSGEVIPKFLMRAMNDLPPVIFGDGGQTRDFTYVDDTARGILVAARTPGAVGETINLGNGTEISVRNLARLIFRVTGKRNLAPEHLGPRPGDVLRLVADTSKAQDLLDWEPTVSLEDGIGRLLKWHDDVGTDWRQALGDDLVHNWESE